MNIQERIKRDILLLSSKYSYLRDMMFSFEVEEFYIMLHIEEDNKVNSEFYEFLEEFKKEYFNFDVIVKFDIYHPWND